MPHFKLKAPMPHLEDATFLFDGNPDPERYEEVVAEAVAAIFPPAAEAAADAQTEEN